MLTRQKLLQLAAIGAPVVGSGALPVFALRFTTAINGALINSSQPALTVVVAWLIFRTRVPWLHIVGIAAAVAGVTIMVSRAEATVLLGMELNRGDLLILAATLGYATYGIIISRANFGVNPWTMLF